MLAGGPAGCRLRFGFGRFWDGTAVLGIWDCFSVADSTHFFWGLDVLATHFLSGVWLFLHNYRPKWAFGTLQISGLSGLAGWLDGRPAGWPAAGWLAGMAG